MVARNTGHGRTRFYRQTAGSTDSRGGTLTAQNKGPAEKKHGKGKFHLPRRVKKNRAAIKAKGPKRTPVDGQLSAITASAPLRPEKMERAKILLQCSDLELDSKLDQVLKRVLEELSYAG